MNNLRLAHDAQFNSLRKDGTVKQEKGFTASVIINGIYQEYKNVECAVEAYNSIEREKMWKAEHNKRFAKKPRVKKEKKLTKKEKMDMFWDMFEKQNGIKLQKGKTMSFNLSYDLGVFCGAEDKMDNRANIVLAFCQLKTNNEIDLDDFAIGYIAGNDEMSESRIDSEIFDVSRFKKIK